MKKISPYYSNYIKGQLLSAVKTASHVRMAVDFYKKAIEIRETEEAYIGLLRAYSLLHDAKSYVETAEYCLEKGYSSTYINYAMLLAGRAENQLQYANKEKALEIFQKAIDLKMPDAFCELATIYRLGTCVFKADKEKSLELLQQGLALNDRRWNGYFMGEIGRHLAAKGEFAKAFDMFTKAVENGYPNANYDIARMYKEGLGVEKNLELYIEHLEKHLNVDSAIEMAGLYLTNQYVEMDLYISESYFNYAANQGSSIGGIMSAAFLVNKGVYDEKLFNRFLEIGFKNAPNDGKYKEKYEYIEEAFGPGVGQKLQELAEKYWNIKVSNEA